MIDTKLIDRCEKKIERIPFCSCWIWTGAVVEDGYGLIAYERTTKRAHRIMYEVAKGPIPDGYELDHLCRIRCCVNPDHLEPVTTKVNIMRGLGLAAMSARRTHCVKGHEYTPENTVFKTYARGRHCVKCRQQWHRDWAEKRKALRCSK